MALLAVVIAAMLLLGSQAQPKVRSFSWQNTAVSASDVAFLMTFSQPVNPRSVEAALKIEPALPGKFSWAGRRMAYTLKASAPYGETYQLSLPAVATTDQEKGFEPFAAEFKTRDRVFAYIGADEEDEGRLVLFNFTRKEKTILTPPDQTVLDFQPYPQRDRILYSAVNDSENASPTLYAVTTGFRKDTEAAPPPRWQFWRHSEPPAAGTFTEILDNHTYQNLKFDLAPDGSVIVVQRVNNENPSDFGPWVVREGESPRKLNTAPGGDFTIAPDSASLLLQQGQGTAVISLNSDITAAEEAELLDFLPEYGLTLDVANDGTAAALVNFNQDDPEKRFTQSLFWVSNSGEEKALLQTDGSILSAQFNEDNKVLYCLVTRLLENTDEDTDAENTVSEESISEESVSEESIDSYEDSEPEQAIAAAEEDEYSVYETYQTVPYLTAVDVKTGQEHKLLEMPPQQETSVSLAPDSLAILFDETLATNSETAADTPVEKPTYRIWLLPLFSTLEERVSGEPIALPPTALEIAGRRPIWLP